MSEPITKFYFPYQYFLTFVQGPYIELFSQNFIEPFLNLFIFKRSLEDDLGTDKYWLGLSH